MKKLFAFTAAGLAGAALAGTAVAAGHNMHVVNVALPDGSTARVEYVGDVAPKITIAAPRVPLAQADWGSPFAGFAGFDRIFEEMSRESDAMLRQAQQMQQTARQPNANGAAPYVASFGSAPGAASSTTVVSYSNGSGTCTRTTQSVSQGAGKLPKVTTSVSGDCGTEHAPAQPSGPISNT